MLIRTILLFLQVAAAQLSGTVLDPKELEHLAGLAHVRELYLPGSAFTPGAGNKMEGNAELKVIAGHGRLLACRELGRAGVPTISLEHLMHLLDPGRPFSSRDDGFESLPPSQPVRRASPLQ